MNARQALIPLAAIATLATLAGCSSASTGPSPASASAASASAARASASNLASAQSAIASEVASQAAASPSDGNLTGPPGTAFTVTGDNGPSGATTTYDVTMTRVTQHAHLGQYDSLTNGDDHVTAAEFTIDGTSGQTSDDADNDAVAVGTDGQDYTASFDTITEGTNFNDGDFRVGPGQSVTGWVAFELPSGVSVASVQWQPGGSQAATWQVK